MDIHSSRIKNEKSRKGLTLVEILVVVVIIGILATMLLSVIANQKKLAKQRLKHIQNRDAIMATAKEVIWNYTDPSNPGEGRRMSKVYFDPDIKDRDLHYLWELIDPFYHHRDRMVALRHLDFARSDFNDQFMTNIIGLKMGRPYRLEGLKLLCLDYTKVTDSGLKFLHKHNPQLQPKAGALAPAWAWDYPMTNLVAVSVIGCPGVTKSGVADLKQNLKNLIVITDWDMNPKGSEDLEW